MTARNNSAVTAPKTPPARDNQSISALSGPGNMFQWPGPIVFFVFGYYDLRDYIKFHPEYVGKKRRGAECKMEPADIQSELHQLQLKIMNGQLPNWQLSKPQTAMGKETKAEAELSRQYVALRHNQAWVLALTFAPSFRSALSLTV
ncbi:hypothetical protein B0H67DRAFT_641099 [Lasiosphaeris hirsuta]|uniref:Uncharacterized protein n=1 Tax=Lasiosphaeris hirsuta TaxID=260670 RepID=A0AA40E4C2_9PEZI|nr:hypothetical protein B0H67DRAFT_641099 [Lasiosphaeris hirsuta]